MHIDTTLKQHTDNSLSVNDTVKFMFLVHLYYKHKFNSVIYMVHCHLALYQDMYVKVAYDNFDNKRRYDDDDEA